MAATPMRNLDPRSMGERVLSTLVLMVAASYVLHRMYEWLAPLTPVAISGVIMLVVWRLLFRRR